MPEISQLISRYIGFPGFSSHSTNFPKKFRKIRRFKEQINITTPLIIFHGESDRRTGFVQGEMLFRSLKVLNAPVEYVRHPGATHDITRSGDNRQRMDQLLRTWEFLQPVD